MRPGKVDTVALDIRPLHDYESSGVGHLGKVKAILTLFCTGFGSSMTMVLGTFDMVGMVRRGFSFGTWFIRHS